MDLLDVHTHLVPYGEASGYPRGVAVDELIAWMDESGVAQAVILRGVCAERAGVGAVRGVPRPADPIRRRRPPTAAGAGEGAPLPQPRGEGIWRAQVRARHR